MALTEHFITPTEDLSISPTLRNCEEVPEECSFMTGKIDDGIIYYAGCKKPIEGSEINIAVLGRDTNIKKPVNEITHINCGKCNFVRGVKRTG